MNIKTINSTANKEILKQTLIDEEKPDLSLTDKLREKNKIRKKKNIKRAAWLSFIIFFIWFLWWGFAPFKGTVPFALCKILIELNVPYPDTLGYTEATQLRTGAIRIWFTHIDGFGVFRMEPFLCGFGIDPETKGSIVTQAKWGNVDLEQSQIDSFNNILPYLVKGEYYDLTAPAPLATNIEDLKFEVDNFRKVQILDLIRKKQ